MKILDIASKDMVRSFRSVFGLGMMFAAPLLITGLIYFAFGGLSSGTGRFNLPDLRVAVVNLDRPSQQQVQLGKMIPEFLRDPAMPAWLKVSEMNDEASARAALENRQLDAAVIIPSNLTDSAVLSDAPASIRVLQDPTLTIGPTVIKDLLDLYLDGVSGGKIALSVASAQAQAAGKPLAPDVRQQIFQQYSDWYTLLQKNLYHSDDPVLASRTPAAAETGAQANPIADMMGKVMAGMMIMFVFFTGANTAQSILREDEEGTLARLFTTPTSRTTVLVGKFAAVFITILVQSIVLLIASALLFQINWGQPVTLLLVTLGTMVAAAGFGVMVASFLKNTRQGGAVIGGVLSVTGMLGGLFTTAIAMPAAFDTLTLSMPQGWALRGYRLALEGAGPSDLALPLLVLLAIGVLFIAIGAFNFKKRFA